MWNLGLGMVYCGVTSLRGIAQAPDDRPACGRGFKMMRCIGLLFVITTLSCQSDLQAGDLVPMDAWIEQPVDEWEPSYPFVRCAGLFAGVLFYLGEGAEVTLGAETFKKWEQTYTELMLAAVIIRADTGGFPADSKVVSDSALNDAYAIATTYEQNLRANYQASGSAMSSDPVFTSDLEICQSFAEIARATIAEVSQ